MQQEFCKKKCLSNFITVTVTAAFHGTISHYSNTVLFRPFPSTPFYLRPLHFLTKSQFQLDRIYNLVIFFGASYTLQLSYSLFAENITSINSKYLTDVWKRMVRRPSTHLAKVAPLISNQFSWKCINKETFCCNPLLQADFPGSLSQA